jgi:hypothetical protein
MHTWTYPQHQVPGGCTSLDADTRFQRLHHGGMPRAVLEFLHSQSQAHQSASQPSPPAGQPLGPVSQAAASIQPSQPPKARVRPSSHRESASQPGSQPCSQPTTHGNYGKAWRLRMHITETKRCGLTSEPSSQLAIRPASQSATFSSPGQPSQPIPVRLSTRVLFFGNDVQ